MALIAFIIASASLMMCATIALANSDDVKRKKLKEEFLQLHAENLRIEDEGCMRRVCVNCNELVRVDEHISTCRHHRNGERMMEIYETLFPDDGYTMKWKDKVQKVKDM